MDFGNSVCNYLDIWLSQRFEVARARGQPTTASCERRYDGLHQFRIMLQRLRHICRQGLSQDLSSSIIVDQLSLLISDRIL